MTNCECKRMIGPSGIWLPEELIGAKVKVLSVPISNMVPIDCGKTMHVEKIDFRISLDGKAITVVTLKECPDAIFTLKDLLFVGVVYKEEPETVEENEEG